MTENQGLPDAAAAQPEKHKAKANPGKEVIIRSTDRKNNMMVTKSNELIQKSRYDLSLVEQKIMLRLIAMIDPKNDSELITFEFSIAEFSKMCGNDVHSGKNYATVKARLKSLSDKSFYISRPGTKRETLVRWIKDIEVDKKHGQLLLKLDPNMTPYLTQLKELFTQFDVGYTLRMKSTYSIRLYELFKSYENLFYPSTKSGRKAISAYEFDVDELKLQLSDSPDPTNKKKRTVAEKYARWADFKRTILDVAVKEINELTDITVDYTPMSSGRGTRKIDKILVTLKKKDKQAISLLDDVAKGKIPTELRDEFAIQNAKIIAQEVNEDLAPSLPYMPTRTGSIDYSSGSNTALMVDELKLRANYDNLLASLDAEKIQIVNTVIKLLAQMCHTKVNSTDEVVDGCNRSILELVNDVILDCEGMEEWFFALSKKYETLFRNEKIKNPVAYLKRCIIEDMQFPEELIKSQRPKPKEKRSDFFSGNWASVFDEE